MCRLMTPQLAEALKGFRFTPRTAREKKRFAVQCLFSALPDGSSLKEKQKGMIPSFLA